MVGRAHDLAQPGTLAIALGAAIAGPLAEILIVELGAASYAEDSDGLAGVAPWLPCLYFGAGAVAAGLWSAIATDGASSPAARSPTGSYP